MHNVVDRGKRVEKYVVLTLFLLILKFHFSFGFFLSPLFFTKASPERRWTERKRTDYLFKDQKSIGNTDNIARKDGTVHEVIDNAL